MTNARSRHDLRASIFESDSAWQVDYRHHGGDLNAQSLFFLFLDDDPRRDHHHQALRFAADADVLEQAVDVRQLAQESARRIRCGLRSSA